MTPEQAQSQLEHALGAWDVVEAQEALQQNNPDEARRQLELALKANPQSVRATILSGDVETAGGAQDAAIVQWRRVEEQNSAYLPLVAEKLMKAYQALGRA